MKTLKNNQAFTLVELIVTFCLVSTISFLLFQIILGLKDIYTSSDFKTILLTKQGNMTRRINRDFFENELTRVEKCDEATLDDGNKLCLLFTLVDTEDNAFTKQLEVYNDAIVYDGYRMDIDNGSKLGSISTVVAYIEDESTKYNSMLKISLPVTNKLTKGDFGVNLIIQYNSVTTNVDETLIDDYEKIQVVTTTVGDIMRRTVVSGDGLYKMSLQDSTSTDLPKYVFKGEMPNNYVIFNKKCYRIMSILQSETVKMIYEGESDNGRCTTIDTSGYISKEGWGEDKSVNNNWYGNQNLIRLYSLNNWYTEQNLNENRLITANFYVGAVNGERETLPLTMTDERENAGSSALPSRNSYAYSAKVGLPSVTDYIMASSNTACVSSLIAATTQNCKTNNYLFKNGYSYWTLNASANNQTDAWAVMNSGLIAETSVKDSSIAVRPVLYFKATTKFSGTGTNSDPYVVK